MVWLVASALVVLFAVPLARRRRKLFVVLPSEPISTMHTAMSRKRTQRTRSAIQAANEILR
jgi:hypothetical protein